MMLLKGGYQQHNEQVQQHKIAEDIDLSQQKLQVRMYFNTTSLNRKKNIYINETYGGKVY